MAIFGSMLTIGIANSLGDMGSNAYVQTLKQSPAASQIIGDNTNDANTLLNLNMPDTKQKITDGFNEAIDKSPAPALVKEQLKQDFTANQQEYNDKVVDSFASGVRKIFIVATIVMALGLALTFTLKERPLATASPDVTPGEI